MMRRLLIPFLALAFCSPAQAGSFIALGDLPSTDINDTRVLKIDIDSIREFKGWTFATMRIDRKYTGRKFKPWNIKVHCRKKYYQRESDMKDIRRNGIWVAEVYNHSTNKQRVDNMVKYVPEDSTLQKERESWSRHYASQDKFKDNVFNFLCKGTMPTSFF